MIRLALLLLAIAPALAHADQLVSIDQFGGGLAAQYRYEDPPAVGQFRGEPWVSWMPNDRIVIVTAYNWPLDGRIRHGEFRASGRLRIVRVNRWWDLGTAFTVVCEGGKWGQGASLRASTAIAQNKHGEGTVFVTAAVERMVEHDESLRWITSGTLSVPIF